VNSLALLSACVGTLGKLPVAQSSGGEMMVVDYMSVLRDEGLRLGTKQAHKKLKLQTLL
jgi:hypothetical protein